jgi:hypothetical protein
VKPERPPAWTEYRVHDNHGGASLASFTAMPLASDFESGPRRSRPLGRRGGLAGGRLAR